jgi:hypothetical protein
MGKNGRRRDTILRFVGIVESHVDEILKLSYIIYVRMLEAHNMQKGKINVTLDKDLIDFAKYYAKYQRTSVSEIFSQFVLNLKRFNETETTDLLLADPDFKKSLIQTISKVRSGEMKWHSYDEVFNESPVQ